MPILQIAKLTIRDLVRRRVLVILGLFALAMILLSFPLRELTIGQWKRLITDVGLGAADLSIALIGILLGSTLVSGDLDRRTLYPLLAKPISRAAFVVGRFLGLAAILATLAFGMSLGTDAMLLLAGQPAPLVIFQATIGIATGALLVGAMSVMFSCFTSTTLAGTFGLSLALICHLNDSLAYFGSKSPSPVLRAISIGLAKGLPNLELLNLKTVAAHGATIPWGDLLSRTAYGLTYAALLIAIGAAVFSRRDLK
jgi:Cu-processing system permease protein